MSRNIVWLEVKVAEYSCLKCCVASRVQLQMIDLLLRKRRQRLYTMLDALPRVVMMLFGVFACSSVDYV